MTMVSKQKWDLLVNTAQNLSFIQQGIVSDEEVVVVCHSGDTRISRN